MKIQCKKGIYKRGERIECSTLGTICPYQRFRTCKNDYWHTDGAVSCKAQADDFKMKEN